MEKTAVNGELAECCKDQENLLQDPSFEAKGGFSARKCQICGRRHYRLKADPGLIGASFRVGRQS